jgi:hypothetical protein
MITWSAAEVTSSWSSLQMTRSATPSSSRLRGGRVVYRYKRPFRDGSTQVVLEPPDFMASLASLVSRPRLNLTRFHGVFASNFRYRRRGP